MPDKTDKILSKYHLKLLLIILLLSLIIRIVFAFVLNPELRSDSMVYDSLAKNIISLGEYSFEGKPTAVLSCGYPLFVSAVYYIFGSNPFYVQLVQSIIDVLSGTFFFLICLSFLSPKNSLVALAMFTFLPSNVLYSQTILTETLFGFLSCVLLYYFLNENIDWKIFLFGMLWGYAVLVRSSFSLSVILVPLFLFIYRKKIFEGYKRKRLKRVFQYSVLFFLGVLIVVLPWLVRNKTVLNTFTIATQGGFTFWSGSNPDATGTWYHKIEETNPLFNIQNEAVRDKEFYKLGFDYAVKNPHKFLITGIKKIGYLFSSERMILLYFTKDNNKTRTSSEIYKSVNPLLIALFNIPYFFVMLAGIWGLLSLNKKAFFIYGFIFIWLITFFIFVALSRYHYVLLPFFIIGTVKILFDYKNSFKNLNLYKKMFAVLFNFFLLGVWSVEFYLLYK